MKCHVSALGGIRVRIGQASTCYMTGIKVPQMRHFWEVLSCSFCGFYLEGCYCQPERWDSFNLSKWLLHIIILIHSQDKDKCTNIFTYFTVSYRRKTFLQLLFTVKSRLWGPTDKKLNVLLQPEKQKVLSIEILTLSLTKLQQIWICKFILNIPNSNS